MHVGNTCTMLPLFAALAGFLTPCGHLHLCFSAAKLLQSMHAGWFGRAAVNFAHKV